MNRKSGVLMHISSLFGDYSIGSFGSEARYFIDFLADCGFGFWQVLPFGMTDEFNSPYKSYSAFGGNPYFVDLSTLYEKGLITADELSLASQQTPYICEYERLGGERIPLLKKAAQRVGSREIIEGYISKREHIDSFCRFMALKEANGGKPVTAQTENEADENTLFAWKFIQYEFFNQWNDIKSYANSRGISVIGDIPIYVSLDSCDVWENPELYLLDSTGSPTNVAGVPPDYFSPDGQLWGNPLYNWDAMKADGYKWWRHRISHMSQMFDALRIDHFRAIESFWAIPALAHTAAEGRWLKGPGMELTSVIRESAGDTMIIAEDLGDITPEVRSLAENSGFPGMRVFQFGFLGEGDSLHKPHNYPFNCVSYTGTHDNNTLTGYLWEMDDSDRYQMLRYCGHCGSWESGCDSIIRTMFASHASLVILPIQDLLGYGSDTRLNTPGRAEGNWQFRLTRSALDSIDRKRFKELNTIYSR